MRQNSQTQIWQNLKTQNEKKKHKQTSNVTKLRMWQKSRTQKHIMWQNTKTKNVIK